TPRPADPTAPRRRARLRGPSATSARTSSWPHLPQSRRSQCPAARLARYGGQRPPARDDAEDRLGGLRRREPGVAGLPPFRFDALLKLERRVSHNGLVSIGGNYCSVP